MGSADLHGLAACGVNLCPSRCTASNVHNDLMQITNCLKRNVYNMMIGIKKRSLLYRFQKSITFLFEKMSPKKVNFKEL
jgi:hypothetical protein